VVSKVFVTKLEMTTQCVRQDGVTSPIATNPHATEEIVFRFVLFLRHVMGASVINHTASIHHALAEDVLRLTQSILNARREE